MRTIGIDPDLLTLSFLDAKTAFGWICPRNTASGGLVKRPGLADIDMWFPCRLGSFGLNAAPARGYEDSDPLGLGVSLSLRNRGLASPAMLRACAPDALDIFHGPWAGGFAAVDAAAAVLHCWLTAQFWPLTSLGTTAFDLP